MLSRLTVKEAAKRYRVSVGTISRWRQMLAIIGNSATRGSIALHRRLGFERVGTLRSVGFKFGRWVDTPLMQRALGAGDRSLPTETPLTAPAR